jgi:hypothetical protein
MFDKWMLMQQRGQFCACGCGKFSSDAHHCCLPNLKRYSEYVNDERNIALVCHVEHVGLRKFDNQKWRKIFYRQNVARYGQELMDEWINSLPDKLRHRLDFLPK